MCDFIYIYIFMTYNLYIYPTTSESAYSVVELSAYSALTTLCLFSSSPATPPCSESVLDPQTSF